MSLHPGQRSGPSFANPWVIVALVTQLGAALASTAVGVHLPVPRRRLAYELAAVATAQYRSRLVATHKLPCGCEKKKRAEALHFRPLHAFHTEQSKTLNVRARGPTVSIICTVFAGRAVTATPAGFGPLWARYGSI